MRACTSGPSIPTPTTIAANPHLKLIFGYPATRRTRTCARSTRDRFVDPQARVALLERLATDGSVADYLLRLRRADSSAVWVELTARADPPAADGSAAHRSARARRQRAQEARRRDARHLPPAAAGRENGGARTDDFRRRARAQQPAGHDPELGRTASQKPTLDDAGPARPRNHPRRIGARRAHRAQPADVRAQASDDARDGRRQSGRARDARAAGLRAARPNITVIDALAAGLPQVFADGHQLQQVLLNLSSTPSRRCCPRTVAACWSSARWHDADRSRSCWRSTTMGPGIADDRAAEDLRSVLHDERRGQGTGLGLTVAYAIVQEHGGRIRLESRAGDGRVVLRRAAGHRREAAAVPATARRARAAARGGRAARPFWWSKTKRRWPAPSPRCCATPATSSNTRQTARRRSRRSRSSLRSRDLRSEDAASRRHGVLSAAAGAAPALAKRVIFVTGDVAGTDAEQFLGTAGAAGWRSRSASPTCCAPSEKGWPDATIAETAGTVALRRPAVEKRHLDDQPDHRIEGDRCAATIRSAARIDSPFLLPKGGRCLTKSATTVADPRRARWHGRSAQKPGRICCKRFGSGIEEA